MTGFWAWCGGRGRRIIDDLLSPSLKIIKKKFFKCRIKGVWSKIYYSVSCFKSISSEFFSHVTLQSMSGLSQRSCCPILINMSLSQGLSHLYSNLSLCFLFRPRLGVTLHKVVVAGALYLLFSGMEGVLRVTGVSTA